MAVLKRQFRISQSGLESCPCLMEDPCRHSRQAPSPYSALHARWLAPRGPLSGDCRVPEGKPRVQQRLLDGRYLAGTCLWSPTQPTLDALGSLDPCEPCEPWRGRAPHSRVEFWSWFPELSSRAQRYAHRGQGDKAGFWFRG